MKVTKSLEFKAEQIDENGKFTGYASVFNGNDSYNDTILKGAFKDSMREGTPLMFFNHDWRSIPIGKWLEIEEDEKGLKVVGELTPGNSEAQNVLSALKHGTITGLSIGFSMKKDGYSEKDNGGRLIKQIDRLIEISVVTFPADQSARIESVKNEVIETIETVRDFEGVLREAGFTKSQALALCAKAKSLFITQRDSDVELTKKQALMDRIIKLGQ